MNNSFYPLDLVITHTQAERLIHYIQVYRGFVWSNIEPTAERNAGLRALQAIHGKIMSKMDQHSEKIILPLLPGERLAMKTMTSNLLSQYNRYPVTQEHTLAIADLTGLRSSLTSE